MKYTELIKRKTHFYSSFFISDEYHTNNSMNNLHSKILPILNKSVSGTLIFLTIYWFLITNLVLTFYQDPTAHNIDVFSHWLPWRCTVTMVIHGSAVGLLRVNTGHVQDRWNE